MNYYITFNIKDKKELQVAGPFGEFEYIDHGMIIINQNDVYNLDFVNEAAFNFYKAYQEVEEEYKEAARQLIENPGCEEWTLEDQVRANRLIKPEDRDFLESIFLEHDSTRSTIDTLQTIDTINLLEDPYDFPF